MESSIITILSQEKNKMMKLEEITKELKVQDTTKLLAVIKNLEETGIIFRDKKGRYTLITNTNLKRGLIKITKKEIPNYIAIMKRLKNIPYIIAYQSEILPLI